VLVVVDELPMIGNEHSWSASLQEIAQQGNGAPHHMGWLVLSQTVLRTPRWARDQADTVIAFWLGNPTDRKALLEARGVDWERAGTLARYEFLAHQHGWTEAQWFPPVARYQKEKEREPRDE
jgi:hypothetical protein